MTDELRLTPHYPEGLDFESYDLQTERFDQGITFACEMLASILGVTHWTNEDGTETHDGDVRATLRGILARRPAPTGMVEPRYDLLLRRLASEAAAQIMGNDHLRHRLDEQQCDEVHGDIQSIVYSLLQWLPLTAAAGSMGEPALEGDGWQWVPKEPTQKMLDAVTAADGHEPFTDKTMRGVYVEMLAAAPKPSALAEMKRKPTP